MRITLIEDSPETYKKLIDVLSARRVIFEAQFINTAPFFDKRIEQRIISFNPSLIVLDLLLVEDAESGLRVLSRLKDSPRLKPIPVIVCSKYIGDDDSGRKYRGKALRLGAAAAVTKIPFPSADIFLKYDHEEISTIRDAESF